MPQTAAERIMRVKAILAADDHQRELFQKTLLGSLPRVARRRSVAGIRLAGTKRCVRGFAWHGCLAVAPSDRTIAWSRRDARGWLCARRVVVQVDVEFQPVPRAYPVTRR